MNATANSPAIRFSVNETRRGRIPNRIFFLGMILLFAQSRTVFGQGNVQTFTIGTKEAPPFVMRTANGTWEGVAIELWRRIAEELDLTYEVQEITIDEMLRGVERGTLDAGVAALTIAAPREERVDFAHPYYVSGLGIAVARRVDTGWLDSLIQIFSPQFLQLVGVLLVILVAVGTLLWLFERKRNVEQFGGDAVRGLGAGLWWSAVTMTTVGYGDKAPRTVAGRAIAVVWMFASIVMVSGFIAGITSALTVNRIDVALDGPEDLSSVRVGTVAGTTSEDYLNSQFINHRTFTTAEAALQAVTTDTVDAIVYDAPILRYLATTEFSGRIITLPTTFDRQDYGIALPPRSPLREPINRIILTAIREPWWHNVLERYMGR